MKLWAWVWQHDIDWIAERLERVAPTEVCTGKTRARRMERLHLVNKKSESQCYILDPSKVISDALFVEQTAS